jgi:hypothetical protein
MQDQPSDQYKARREALAKVYALLLRLAADEHETVDSGSLGGVTLSTAEWRDSGTEQEAFHE